MKKITFFKCNKQKTKYGDIEQDGGVKKKVRRENKGLVDEVSATIILEDWMSSHRY